MSLYGANLSFVSIGCSCQSAHQLTENQKFLEALKGAEFRKRGGYFDYLITPIETVIRLVEEGIPELPSAEVVETDSGSYWRDQDLWFYHYFKTPDDTENSMAKISHLRQSFMSLDKPSVFVLSNTQNNLAGFCQDKTFFEQFAFTTDRLARLRDALAARFEENFAGLMVVENLQTTAGAEHLDMVSRLLVGEDDSVWQGSVEDWRFCFRNAVASLSRREKFVPYEIPKPAAVASRV